MTKTGSLDLDLLFTSSNENYQARVARSPAGESEPVEFFVPANGLERERFLLWTGRPRTWSTSRGPYAFEELEELGREIFNAVFTGPALECLHASVDAARSAGATLRIRLSFSAAPDLAELPWELMHDEALGFLALSDATSVVRYAGMAVPPPPRLTADPPLRVLVARSAAADRDREDTLERLVDSVADLAMSGLLSLVIVDIDEVGDTLRDQAFDILHVLETDFPAYYGLLRGGLPGLRLVLFDTSAEERDGLRDSFLYPAEAASDISVPAVITRLFGIDDKRASEFLPTLYTALATGQPVDAAVAEARVATWAVSHHGWAAAVLHLGIDDTQLFGISASEQGMAAARADGADRLRDDGRFADAEAQYRVALTLDPASARAYAGLAVALSALDRNAEAEDASLAALQLDPADARVREQLVAIRRTLYPPPDQGWREMEVIGVRVEEPTSNPLVLLRELGRDRYLPIWLSAVNATAIAMAHQGMTASRPMVHDLLCLILGAVNLRLRYAAIDSLKEGVFSARLSLSNGRTPIATPSDAITLTLLAPAVLYASGDILDEAGIAVSDAQAGVVEGLPEPQESVAPPPSEAAELIELEVVGVRVEMPSNSPIVLMKEKTGDRYLPVWIGAVEATAVHYAKEGTAAPELHSHELMCDIMAAADVRLLNACFVALDNGVFYTDLNLSNATTISCRPSDAVTLTLITKAPLCVSAALLDEVGVPIPDEPQETAAEQT